MPVWQSSTLYSYHAYRAIDGNDETYSETGKSNTSTRITIVIAPVLNYSTIVFIQNMQTSLSLLLTLAEIYIQIHLKQFHVFIFKLENYENNGSVPNMEVGLQVHIKPDPPPPALSG